MDLCFSQSEMKFLLEFKLQSAMIYSMTITVRSSSKCVFIFCFFILSESSFAVFL